MPSEEPETRAENNGNDMLVSYMIELYPDIGIHGRNLGPNFGGGGRVKPVSYTHLDVYKRQLLYN